MITSMYNKYNAPQQVCVCSSHQAFLIHEVYLLPLLMQSSVNNLV
jgi:hypothetical protein